MASQPTTRWQVSGYRFLMRRMEHALVRRDVRMIHDPMRSQGRSLMVGMVVACLVLAGCAALALFRPQDRIGNATLVVGRDSGALYVAIDGVFHPAMNLASARLVLDDPAEPTVVADEELESRARGPLVGIPGAPSSLAYVDHDLSWTVCDTVDAGGRKFVTTAVTAGTPEYTGVGGPLDDDEALLMTFDGEYHLVYGGGRAEIDPQDRALTRVLGIDVGSARPVGEGLLAAIPELPELTAPVIPGAGGRPRVGVGDVLVGSVVGLAEPGGQRYYVVLNEGVQEVSSATAQIIHAADSQGVAEIPIVPPDTLKDAPTVHHLAVDTFPAVVPTIVDPADRPVGCLTWKPGEGPDDQRRSELVLSAGSVLPIAQDSIPVAPAQADGQGPNVDVVHIPPGRGTFVQTTSVVPDSERRGALFYIADTGVRYGIADAEAATALGLEGEPARAPWQIVDLLAPGPSLGRAEALLAHDGVAPDPRPAPLGTGE
ncbi:type VII secretion protein EccB [Rhodococcus artemisiae]|uniref:Type VII secretion protein EccB n=1 Tax=Rhodococcus artemisiae TaxID=714159 RepID=A0ABU7LKK0_9NOCA|nr:type VII secretion protein EccB [Rhodococcus artemisiae]MEE2062090.1 type VII secretion protein EccB [Rhodococcus artemisiae]